MSHSAIEYLRHILDEIDYLERACSSLEEKVFLKDETLKRSFVRSVEIIGEAAKQLPEDFKNTYDYVPWKRISGMRDRLIHAYFGVDYMIVWDVVKNKLPELKQQIMDIVNGVNPTIRKRGINYLQKKLGQESADLVSVSKYFEAHESWTQKQTWWFNLPIKKIETKPDSYYYLVGGIRNIKEEFIVLKVPNKFLLDNIGKFDTINETTIVLHLAAHENNWLVDERVKNGVDFSSFEMK